jgi:hypothetical protein
MQRMQTIFNEKYSILSIPLVDNPIIQQIVEYRLVRTLEDAPTDPNLRALEKLIRVRKQRIWERNLLIRNLNLLIILGLQLDLRQFAEKIPYDAL